MSRNMVRINPDTVKLVLTRTGLSKSDLSLQLGHSRCYLNQVLKAGTMRQSDVTLFCLLYGAEEDEMIYHEPVPAPEPEQLSIESPKGYNVAITVMEDRIRASLEFNGMPLYDAVAKLWGDKEVDLVQAISYATHLIFKMAQQDDLKGAK